MAKVKEQEIELEEAVAQIMEIGDKDQAIAEANEKIEELKKNLQDKPVEESNVLSGEALAEIEQLKK